MLITIVTPVLNGARTLEDTLRSVREQDHPDVEHVVVDGGSTDGTLALLESFADAGLRWISGPDRGISDAFNKGIDLARGEVVGIINADDWLWQGALARVARAFADDPGLDVLYGNVCYLDPRTGRTVVGVSEPDLRAVGRRLPLRHPAAFVRRSAYARFGAFDLRYRYAMDYELVLRFHRGGARFRHLDEVLAGMRTDGLTARNFGAMVRETRDISVRYGMSPLRAGARSGALLAKGHLRRALEGGALAWMLRGYRALSPRFRSAQPLPDRR